MLTKLATISGVALLSLVAGMGWYQVSELKHEAWLQENYLFECGGAVLRIKGTEVAAQTFVRANCPDDFNLTIANQDLGL